MVCVKHLSSNLLQTVYSANKLVLDLECRICGLRILLLYMLLLLYLLLVILLLLFLPCILLHLLSTATSDVASDFGPLDDVLVWQGTGIEEADWNLEAIEEQMLSPPS